jgi:cell division septation protein DedD
VVVADPPPVLKMDTSGAGGLYQVQIGAFGSEANATKLRQQALAIGYGAVVVPQPRNGTTLYLVRVKGLTSAGEAQQVSASLARRLGVQSVVVPPARQDR